MTLLLIGSKTFEATVLYTPFEARVLYTLAWARE